MMRAHLAPTVTVSRELVSRIWPGARAAGPRDPGRGDGGGGRGLGSAPQRRAGVSGPRRAEPLLLPLGVKMAPRGTWSSPGA